MAWHFYREKYLSLYGDALEMAKNLLSHSPSLQDLVHLQRVARHGGSTSVVAVPTTNIARNPSAEKNSPKARSRANTIIAFKPSSTDDIVTTTKSVKHRGGVLKSKGNKVERSQTFLGKDEKKERPLTAHAAYTPQTHHRSSSSAGGGTGLDDFTDGGNFIANGYLTV